MEHNYIHSWECVGLTDMEVGTGFCREQDCDQCLLSDEIYTEVRCSNDWLSCAQDCTGLCVGLAYAAFPPSDHEPGCVGEGRCIFYYRDSANDTFTINGTSMLEGAEQYTCFKPPSTDGLQLPSLSPSPSHTPSPSPEVAALTCSMVHLINAEACPNGYFPFYYSDAQTCTRDLCSTITAEGSYTVAQGADFYIEGPAVSAPTDKCTVETVPHPSGTAYQLCVSVCPGSEWSINLQDEGGNGWEDNYLQATSCDSNTTIIDLTLDYGSAYQHTRCLDATDGLSVSVQGGVGQSEIQWSLVDPAGVPRLSGGAPFLGSLNCRSSCVGTDIGWFVEMTDFHQNIAGGNGWEGNTLRITDCNGTVLATDVTLVAGEGAVVDVCLPYRDIYVVDVDGGVYQEEIGWKIKDEFGRLKLQGGAPYHGTTKQGGCLTTSPSASPSPPASPSSLPTFGVEAKIQLTLTKNYRTMSAEEKTQFQEAFKLSLVAVLQQSLSDVSTGKINILSIAPLSSKTDVVHEIRYELETSSETEAGMAVTAMTDTFDAEAFEHDLNEKVTGGALPNDFQISGTSPVTILGTTFSTPTPSVLPSAETPDDKEDNNDSTVAGAAVGGVLGELTISARACRTLQRHVDKAEIHSCHVLVYPFFIFVSNQWYNYNAPLVPTAPQLVVLASSEWQCFGSARNVASMTLAARRHLGAALLRVPGFSGPTQHPAGHA